MFLLLMFLLFVVGGLIYLLSRASNSERRAELGRLSFIIGLVFFCIALYGEAGHLILPTLR